MLKQAIENTNSYIDIFGCCILYYDLFNNPHYHSYIVRDNDNMIFDFAHNITTSVDLYNNEFEYNILLKEKASKILIGIEKLRAIDSEFDKSEIKNEFLKYALHSQITRKNR